MLRCGRVTCRKRHCLSLNIDGGVKKTEMRLFHSSCNANILVTLSPFHERGKTRCVEEKSIGKVGSINDVRKDFVE